MQVNSLPSDLAQFVNEAVASGQYPSTDALVCEALQVLRAQRHPQGAPPPPATPGHGPLSSPDAYLQALAQALRTGEFGRARQLATEGAARYPAHAALAQSAQVLAPPTVRRARHAHTADIRANRAWLKAHRQAYAGQWVAIRDGHFLAAAPSFAALTAQVEATPAVLMTQVPTCP